MNRIEFSVLHFGLIFLPESNKTPEIDALRKKTLDTSKFVLTMPVVAMHKQFSFSKIFQFQGESACLTFPNSFPQLPKPILNRNSPF